MLISDSLIPLSQCLVYMVIISIVLISVSVWALIKIKGLEKEKLSGKKIVMNSVLFFVMMFFCFLIQAFQIPVPYGTSVGLIGAALVTIIFRSPWAALLVMTPVVLVQSVFGYGGITTIGANLFTMGIIGGISGYYTYVLVRKISPEHQNLLTIIGGFLAGFVSLIMIGISTTLELVIAGTFPLVESMKFIFIYSMVAGLAEGLMTALACVGIVIYKIKIHKQKPTTAQSNPP